MPQLITGSTSQYEETAIGLAQGPAQLLQIRSRLAQNRSSTALFDTERYTRNLEAAYAEIHQRYHSGAAPEHVNEHLAS